MQDNSKSWDDSLISMGLGALVVVISGILIYNYFSDQTPKLLKLAANPSNSPVAVQNSASPSVAQSSALAVATNAPVQPIKTTPQPTTTTTATTSQSLPGQHTVARGDSLWAISAKYYGTGFEWKRIAEANKMGKDSHLVAGMNLTIPRAELTSSTSTVIASNVTPVPTSSVAPSTPAPTQVAQATVAPTPSAQAGQTIVPAQTTTQDGRIMYVIAKGDTLWSIAGKSCGNNYAWSSIAKQNKLDHPGVIHSGNVLMFTCQ